jgi:hypothetical protein
MTPLWAQRQEELLSDCLVSPDVFNHMVDRLCDFVAPYQHALETEASQRNVHLYLAGLLSHLDRKNAEKIAALVDVERLVIQQFIGTAPWDHRPLIKVLVGQVVERLGEPDGIIAFDPSSVPKRGTHSVGVKRQWCGHRAARSTPARWACTWDTSLATTMPCSTSVCPCPRSGPGMSHDAKPVTCLRTCRIARGMISAWRCSTSGASKCPTAG